MSTREELIDDLMDKTLGNVEKKTRPRFASIAPYTMECSAHPDAPHGFNRNASHNEGRYVCECEHWKEPK